MFYVFTCTPLQHTTEDTATEALLRLTPGIIHQVDVLFQDGCDHAEHVQIWDRNFMLWPSNRGENLRGNATVVSFREFYEIVPAHRILTAKTWTAEDTADIVEVIIQIGLLPKRIIQPMAFEELLAAAAGIP
jgi:hypothetical protein